MENQLPLHLKITHSHFDDTDDRSATSSPVMPTKIQKMSSASLICSNVAVGETVSNERQHDDGLESSNSACNDGVDWMPAPASIVAAVHSVASSSAEIPPSGRSEEESPMNVILVNDPLQLVSTPPLTYIVDKKVPNNDPGDVSGVTTSPATASGIELAHQSRPLQHEVPKCDHILLQKSSVEISPSNLGSAVNILPLPQPSLTNYVEDANEHQPKNTAIEDVKGGPNSRLPMKTFDSVNEPLKMVSASHSTNRVNLTLSKNEQANAISGSTELQEWDSDKDGLLAPIPSAAYSVAKPILNEILHSTCQGNNHIDIGYLTSLATKSLVKDVVTLSHSEVLETSAMSSKVDPVEKSRTSLELGDTNLLTANISSLNSTAAADKTRPIESTSKAGNVNRLSDCGTIAAGDSLPNISKELAKSVTEYDEKILQFPETNCKISNTQVTEVKKVDKVGGILTSSDLEFSSLHSSINYCDLVSGELQMQECSSQGQSESGTSSSDMDNKERCKDGLPIAKSAPVLPARNVVYAKSVQEGRMIFFGDTTVVLTYDILTKKCINRETGTFKVLHLKTGKVHMCFQKGDSMLWKHSLTSSMKFNPLKSVDEAYSWCSVDLQNTNFDLCLYVIKFESCEIASIFKQIIDIMQARMTFDTIPPLESAGSSSSFGDNTLDSPLSKKCKRHLYAGDYLTSVIYVETTGTPLSEFRTTVSSTVPNPELKNPIVCTSTKATDKYCMSILATLGNKQNHMNHNCNKVIANTSESELDNYEKHDENTPSKAEAYVPKHQNKQPSSLSTSSECHVDVKCGPASGLTAFMEPLSGPSECAPNSCSYDHTLGQNDVKADSIEMLSMPNLESFLETTTHNQPTESEKLNFAPNTKTISRVVDVGDKITDLLVDPNRLSSTPKSSKSIECCNIIPQTISQNADIVSQQTSSSNDLLNTFSTFKSCKLTASFSSAATNASCPSGIQETDPCWPCKVSFCLPPIVATSKPVESTSLINLGSPARCFTQTNSVAVSSQDTEASDMEIHHADSPKDSFGIPGTVTPTQSTTDTFNFSPGRGPIFSYGDFGIPKTDIMSIFKVKATSVDSHIPKSESLSFWSATTNTGFDDTKSCFTRPISLKDKSLDFSNGGLKFGCNLPVGPMAASLDFNVMKTDSMPNTDTITTQTLQSPANSSQLPGSCNNDPTSDSKISKFGITQTGALKDSVGIVPTALPSHSTFNFISKSFPTTVGPTTWPQTDPTKSAGLHIPPASDPGKLTRTSNTDSVPVFKGLDFGFCQPPGFSKNSSGIPPAISTQQNRPTEFFFGVPIDALNRRTSLTGNSIFGNKQSKGLGTSQRSCNRVQESTAAGNSPFFGTKAQPDTTSSNLFGGQPQLESSENPSSGSSIWKAFDMPECRKLNSFNFSLDSHKESPNQLPGPPCKTKKTKKKLNALRRGVDPKRELSNAEFESSVLRSLECPICLEPCIPPIYTCCKGHHVCSQCRSRIRACGVCKSPLSTARNWFAEEISRKIVKVVCKNSNMGCKEKVYFMEMDKHVQTCKFSVGCLSETAVNGNTGFCQWRGPLEDLRVHIDEVHAAALNLPQSNEYCITFGTSSYALVKEGDSYFQCFVEYCRDVKGWHVYCRYLGLPKRRLPYTCEFSFLSKYKNSLALGQGSFQLTYTNKILHFADDYNKASTLLLNEELFKRLMKKGYKIYYTVKIISE